MTFVTDALADSRLSAQPKRVYSNQGNRPLLELLDNEGGRVLDVGCGAGDNAALLKERLHDARIFGVTHSRDEADLASRFMSHCWVFDIESEFPPELNAQRFDALIFSHVLEHLRNPAAVLARFSQMLRRGGVILIAVPNLLCWRQRLDFLFGRFEYQQAGVLDDTHLRFFTYFTADEYLLAQSPDLKLQFKGVTGSVPLWGLRRHIFPRHWSESLDRWGCDHWPNLFGGQILIKARKQ